ncbi:hypothetical protein TNCV_4621721 [Trichonephila clavipes]|nr:hypothetical protein TNCV_4621721 [Trichonephila clavipes]
MTEEELKSFRMTYLYESSKLTLTRCLTRLELFLLIEVTTGTRFRTLRAPNTSINLITSPFLYAATWFTVFQIQERSTQLTGISEKIVIYFGTLQ